MANDPDGRDGFQISRVSISGAAGALVAVGGVIILVAGAPPLRWVVLGGLVGGMLLGGALWALRHR